MTTTATCKSGGCLDTDNNSLDFVNALPTPRNKSSATNACATTTPPATALPIVLKTCPASLSIDVGSAGFASLVATDPDSIVNGASISAGARAGISLSTFVAATSVGGDASVRLNADASVPSGVYKVDVTFTNNASQSATCSVGVSAAGTRTIPQN